MAFGMRHLLPGTVMTPFIILAIFFFAEETEIPA